MKKIVVIGTGYVGLVTGASFADLNHHVTCVDIDLQKVKSLQNGIIPFFEPGLSELTGRCTEKGNLHFTNSYREALKDAELCFLALPTPSSIDESCDISFILAAATELAKMIQNDLIVINKSTAPVGTAKKIKRVIEETLEQRNVSFSIDVVSNPEFLREGSAVRDFKSPQRILLGVENEQTEKVMRELYRPFLDKILVMDIASSELAKYAANAMLALRLTMINDLSGICEKLGADIEAIRIALGKDPRIGHHYLHPGVGFGGSCLPKDVRALRATCKQIGHSTELYDVILNSNHRQQNAFYDKIEAYYGDLSGKTLAIWGLSFKPDTDDIREAPAIFLAQKLIQKGATLRLYDPAANEKARPFFSEDAVFCANEIDAACGADGIILMTEWKPFAYAPLEKISTMMGQKVFFDGRNFFNAKKMEELGFDYFSIGKMHEKQPAFL